MKHTESTGISRRRLLAMAGLSAGSLLAQPPLFADRGGDAPAAANATASTRNTSFSSLKQIDAGLLNVGYAEAGPANGPAVILLQGWPYDIYSYVDIAPLLASTGYRVIVQCVLQSHIKMTHAAPPTNITAASVLNLCNPLIAKITNPKLTTPVDTMDSIAHLSRADCMTKTPCIHQRDDVESNHRLLSIPKRFAGKKARRAVTPQIG